MGRGIASWVGVGVCAFALSFQLATAQQAQLPPVIQFSGVLKNAAGQALVGTQGVQFAAYSNQEGGSSLWIESQNGTTDAAGRFPARLDSATPGGLPVELFSSGASRRTASLSYLGLCQIGS